jgi:hypothetical protein
MPGMASWRQLYRLEYMRLFEEGYPVGDTPLPDQSADYTPRPRCPGSLRFRTALWRIA